jgi:hypothetical protein
MKTILIRFGLNEVKSILLMSLIVFNYSCYASQKYDVPEGECVNRNIIPLYDFEQRSLNTFVGVQNAQEEEGINRLYVLMKQVDITPNQRAIEYFNYSMSKSKDELDNQQSHLQVTPQKVVEAATPAQTSSPKYFWPCCQCCFSSNVRVGVSR